MLCCEALLGAVLLWYVMFSAGDSQFAQGGYRQVCFCSEGSLIERFSARATVLCWGMECAYFASRRVFRNDHWSRGSSSGLHVVVVIALAEALLVLVGGCTARPARADVPSLALVALPLQIAIEVRNAFFEANI